MVFILSALWWIRTRGLWKLPDGRDWLRGKLGLSQFPDTCFPDICTPTFIAALFTVSRTWKQPRCPKADEWIRKLWYVNWKRCTTWELWVKYYFILMGGAMFSKSLTQLSVDGWDCVPEAKLWRRKKSPGKFREKKSFIISVAFDVGNLCSF